MHAWMEKHGSSWKEGQADERSGYRWIVDGFEEVCAVRLRCLKGMKNECYEEAAFNLE
jgi:hypothetical protein